MPIRSTALAMMAGCALAISGASADAAVRVVTYTGTVGTSFDSTGLFGSVGPLNGSQFTAVYTYDGALGTRQTSPTSDSVFGGTSFGTDNPLLDATLTINGSTIDLFGAQSGSANISSESIGELSNGDQFVGFVHQFRELGLSGSGIFPASLDTPFSANISGTGHFHFEDFFVSPFGLDHDISSTTGDLLPTFVSVADPR